MKPAASVKHAGKFQEVRKRKVTRTGQAFIRLPEVFLRVRRAQDRAFCATQNLDEHFRHQGAADRTEAALLSQRYRFGEDVVPQWCIFREPRRADRIKLVITYLFSNR